MLLTCYRTGPLTIPAYVPADPIITALDSTGAQLPDRTAYEKDYKVSQLHKSRLLP